MNKPLEKYFIEAGKARIPQPLMDDNDILAILDSEPGSASLNIKPSKRIWRIIMGVLGLSIIITLITFLSATNDKISTHDQQTLNSNDGNYSVNSSKQTTKDQPSGNDNKKNTIENGQNIDNKSEVKNNNGLLLQNDKISDPPTTEVIIVPNDEPSFLFEKKDSSNNDSIIKEKKKNKNSKEVTVRAIKPLVDVIHPEKSWKDSTGKDIPGIIALELNKDELLNLGIKLTDTTCIFNTEQLDIIHPIPYRRVPEYRNRKSMRQLVAANYDTTGKFFITKEIREINLTDKDIPRKLDSINKAIKATRNPGGWYETKSRYDEIEVVYLEDNMILNKKLVRYTGWDSTDYSKVTPACYGYTYRDTNKSHSVYISQIPINHPHQLGYTYNQNVYNLQDMIPIRVHLADKAVDPKQSGYTLSFIIFWYFPTNEFVNALPDRYREPLRNELDVINQINSGLVPPEEACKSFDDKESFFEICRLNSGALGNMSLSPNPVSHAEEVTCSFKLTAERKITITLHDISGKYITTIMKNENKTPDDYNININLSGIAKGVYLVAVTTDRGEQVVQRLIFN
jgi:hypothetical protein